MKSHFVEMPLQIPIIIIIIIIIITNIIIIIITENLRNNRISEFFTRYM